MVGASRRRTQRTGFGAWCGSDLGPAARRSPLRNLALPAWTQPVIAGARAEALTAQLEAVPFHHPQTVAPPEPAQPQAGGPAYLFRNLHVLKRPSPYNSLG